MKTILHTKSAPEAIGPYSQGVEANGLIFTSGQLGLVPETGTFPEGGIKAQTRQSLMNVNAVLEAGHSSLKNAVKLTVFLRDMDDFSAVNQVYGEFFPEKYPARSAVQAARLPKDALIEIEAVALVF